MMNKADWSIVGLGLIALGVIVLLTAILMLINKPGPRYARRRDLSDSMPVNAPSSDRSLPLRDFIFLSGDSLVIKARSEEEAWKKFEADCDDAPCPCGLPQEYDDEVVNSLVEVAYCDCVQSHETLTWVQEV